MPTKKLVGAAAFTAALAAGGAAGALFGTPVLSGAQEADNDPSTDNATTAEAPRSLGRGAKGENLTTAADVLGITAEELRTELAAGKSIADVAAEKGVDKQKVIDALVAAATARIDEMKAELPERIAQMVERDGLPHGPGGPGGPGGHRHHGGAINAIDDAATALGVSVQELRDELAAGKSIATIASEKGKSLDEVKAAMIADANARIDQAVANGRLTAEEGAAKKAEVAEKVDEVVQREGLPMRAPRAPRPAPEAEADNASTTA